MTVIELKSVTIRRGRCDVLTDITRTFDVGAHAILGRNGMGKSTLLACLAGALAPIRGRVLIDGVDIYRSVVASRRKLFYVPDNAQFFPFVTGRDFLGFVLSAHKGKGNRAVGMNPFVQPFGIDLYMDTRFDQMSLGTRMKFFLAAALDLRPRLLVLDEPFNGLDEASTTITLAALKDLSVRSACLVPCDSIEERVWRLSSARDAMKQLYQHLGT